jgi:hypothetical protein
MVDNVTDDQNKDVGFLAVEVNDDFLPFDNEYFPVDPFTKYLQYALMTVVGINIVGLGGQVQGEVMLKLIQKPFTLGLGMFCRLALMPAVSIDCTSLNVGDPLSC